MRARGRPLLPSSLAARRQWLRGGATWPAASGAPGTRFDNLEALTLLSMGVFGVVGFVRGARREWVSLASAIIAYGAVEWFWPSIAAALNRATKLMRFAVVERGMLADDPSASWSNASAAPPLVPVDSPAVVWQIAVFTAIVLAGYLLSQLVGRARIGGFAALVRLPDLVERLIGALMGAATGYIIATFLLARLFPDLGVTLVGPGAQLPGIVARLGPPGVFAIVALFVLFGVLSLGTRGRQVFGG